MRLRCLPSAFKRHEKITTEINIDGGECGNGRLIDEGDEVVPDAAEHTLDQWMSMFFLVLVLQALNQHHYFAEFLHELKWIKQKHLCLNVRLLECECDDEERNC